VDKNKPRTDYKNGAKVDPQIVSKQDGRAEPTAEATAEAKAEPRIDAETMSAAIAGFLACHVLTCRFLVQEGIVDKDRFTAFLEDALAQMSPDIKDQRSLFGLQQIISSLRSPPPEAPAASADNSAQP
jgi:hypothetical protein